MLRGARHRLALRRRAEMRLRGAQDAEGRRQVDVEDVPVTAVSITMMLSNLWIWYRENRTGTRAQVIETVTLLALRMLGATTDTAK